MPNSRNKVVRQKLVELLSEITIANGYATDVAIVAEEPRTMSTSGPFPELQVYFVEDEYLPDAGPLMTDVYAASFRVEGLVQALSDDPSLDLAADVTFCCKQLIGNLRLGIGWIIPEVRVTGTKLSSISEEMARAGMRHFAVGVEVSIKHLDRSPYAE